MKLRQERNGEENWEKKTSDKTKKTWNKPRIKDKKKIINMSKDEGWPSIKKK